MNHVLPKRTHSRTPPATNPPTPGWPCIRARPGPQAPPRSVAACSAPPAAAASSPAPSRRDAPHQHSASTSPSTTGTTSNSSGSTQHFELLSERGVSFTPGSAFYRPESAQARDLAVLAAAVHARSTGGQLRVLDVMSGSGVRGARYIQQAGAQFVWSNDFNPSNSAALVANVCGAAAGSGPQAWLPGGGSASPEQPSSWKEESITPPGLKRSVRQWHLPRSSAALELQDTLQSSPANGSGSGDGNSRSATATSSNHASSSSSTSADAGSQEREGAGVTVRVSHIDAHRLLCSVALNEDYFDLVDIDSFGSETSFLGAALEAVRYGGLLYLTSTDGFCSAGHRPERSLAAYGAYLRAMPFSNEQGLRMLIGAAVKEGAARGMVVTPLFSLYSYHGPVFRVMLRVTRSAEWPSHHYGFVGHCHVHGDTRTVGWRHLGDAHCRCCVPPKGSSSDQQQQQQPVMEGESSSASNSSRPEAAASSSRHTGPPLSLSGPMWTGPLHCGDMLREMHEEAGRRGWLGHDLAIASPHTSAGTAKSSPSAEAGRVSTASGSSGTGATVQSSQEASAVISTASNAQSGGADSPAAVSANMSSPGGAHNSVGPSTSQGTGSSGASVIVRSKKNGPLALGALLQVLEEEADERLGPGYLKLDTVAQHLACHPSRDKLIAELRVRGFAASRCHIEARALRTDANMQQVLRACHFGLGIKLRPTSPFVQLLSS